MLTHGIPPDVHGGVHIILPPHTIGSVPSLSGHAIAYRWRSLPRVRWHRASSPQGSSSNRCCLWITMGQLVCTPLFCHTPNWYKVSIVKLSEVYHNISTAVLLYCCTVLWTRFPPPTCACTSAKSQVYTVQYHLLFVKILSRLYYCCTVDLFPPDSCVYKCKEFSVHGITSSVVFQNIIITAAVLKTRPPPPTSACMYKCNELEFRVSSKLFTGMRIEKQNICIPDGNKNAGLPLHYIGV